MAGFVDERSLTRDPLWFVDMTVGPDGQRMDFDARMDDVRACSAPDHYVIRALDVGTAERRAAVARASEWIDSLGMADQVEKGSRAGARRVSNDLVFASRRRRAWTPRELRHSFVSLLSDDGVPIEQISRLVGHIGTSVTELVCRKQIRPVAEDDAAVTKALVPVSLRSL